MKRLLHHWLQRIYCSHLPTVLLSLGFLMKQVLEVSSPRVEVGFHFRRFPALVAILGMSYFMPEVTECRARLGDRAVNADPDTFNFTILFNRLTHTAIGKNFWEDRINALNKLWRHAQSAAFWLDLRFKKSFNDFVEFVVRHFPKDHYSRERSRRLIEESGEVKNG